MKIFALETNVGRVKEHFLAQGEAGSGEDNLRDVVSQTQWLKPVGFGMIRVASKEDLSSSKVLRRSLQLP